jgi:hypothetical protein
MFDSMGISRLNPYRHVQPGMTYSASSYGSNVTRALSSLPQSLHPVANTVQDQGWPQGPSHSSQLLTFGHTNTMTAEFHLPSDQAPRAPISPPDPGLPGNIASSFAALQAHSTHPSIGHVSTSHPTSSGSGAPPPHVNEIGPMPAIKANKAGTWTIVHTTAVIGRITSSQELYNQIMVTSRSLCNVEQANRVWSAVRYSTYSLQTPLIVLL